MEGPQPVGRQISGYVLAGGKSSRMGTDKALLELGGKPLIQHAVEKLRRVCTDVRILSRNPVLGSYAPLVEDLHADCGPIGGMETGLVNASFEWSLFLAIDMPFLPTALIADLVQDVDLGGDGHGAWIRLFSVDGRPQPGFCMLHREVLPYLSEAIARGEHKLMRVFEEAGITLAEQNGFQPGAGLWCVPITDYYARPVSDQHRPRWCYLTEAQQRAQHLWFANLNTPGEFADAERHVDALDT